MNLADLSDAQLLESLKVVCGQSRALLAHVLAHLVEVEERRLHLEAACPSMFQFCVRRLGMSEDEACRRIHAARLVRRFPDLLLRIERGELTLSTLAVLHDALTEASYDALVAAAAGKTKAEVQALIAKRWPMPDVPAEITTIPTQTSIGTVGVVPVAAAAAAAPGGPQLAPLSGTRHKVQFTATDELRRKLERARDLMRHANADGDLAVVVERAVDLLLEKLEKQRLGESTRPRRSPEEKRAPDDAPEHGLSRVSRATRRAVFERDGERCTFTDAEGHRCPETSWLELDHVIPRARGGTDALGNLRVRCRAHNKWYAEQMFGKGLVESKIRERRHPRTRGYGSESCELAASGLVNIGLLSYRCPTRSRRGDRAAPERSPRRDPGPDDPARSACRLDVAVTPSGSHSRERDHRRPRRLARQPGVPRVIGGRPRRGQS